MSRQGKIAAVVILAVLALAGITVTLALSSSNNEPWPGLTGSTKPSFEATVTMTVAVETARECSRGGYSDIHNGAQVQIVNQKNEVLAVGNLNSYISEPCKFNVGIKIPTGERMYGAKVGNANRGVIWKTEDEAKTIGWDLVLGN